jgi:hypothetical protein
MASREQQQALVAALAATARAEILRDFRADSCIVSTRIALEVLRRFGVGGYALSVRAMIANAPFLERLKGGAAPPAGHEDALRWAAEDGAWLIGLGFGEAGPGRWPGHLVVIAERRWLVDLSLDQASRPQRSIVLRPLVAVVGEPFLRGRKALEVPMGGSLVRYEAVPRDRSYRNAPDWDDPRRWAPAVQRIVARLAAAGISPRPRRDWGERG